jgi:hypothetical protein
MAGAAVLGAVAAAALDGDSGVVVEVGLEEPAVEDVVDELAVYVSTVVDLDDADGRL